MKKILLAILVIVCTAKMYAQTPAFPGAEGYGRYITGGRGGEIRHVTNLNDSGTGSLRAAVNGSNKKIVVFDVAGIIALKSDLTIGANTTIEGQTAPSPGITIRYYSVRPNGDNIIMRFIRVRRGEEKNINDGADACWAKNFVGMILDHCSFSWSIDEVSSFYDNSDFTMQWCTIAEALANPGHSKGEHSYGGIWGGKGASFHHNMICHVQNRAPRLCGARYGWTGYDSSKYPGGTIRAEQVDLRNNLMYNWGRGNGAYGAMGGYHNIVNNYYKAGPATNNTKRVFQCGKTTGANTDGGSAIDPDKKGIYGHFYINGNYVTAAGTEAANYDWKGVIVDGVSSIPDTIKLSSPISTFVNEDVTTHTAENAYLKILDYVGASLFRDSQDKRYVREAKNGTTTYTGTATKQGDGSAITHWPGIIDFVSDQGGYSLASNIRSSSFDADYDGMADEWEEANGGNLEPNEYTLDEKGWYTNIEVYCNSLVQNIMQEENKDAQSAVDEYYPECTIVDVNESDPATGNTGSITWPLNNSTTAVVASSVSDGIASTSVTLGSGVHTSGSAAISGSTFTKYQPDTENETAATANNSIVFSFSVKDGYKFHATGIKLLASNIGNTKGKIDATWNDSNGKVSVLTGAVPAKNSDGGYTEYDENISDNTEEVTGDCSLSIGIYNLATGSNGSIKEIGLANIIIEGTLISPTGISTPVTFSLPVSIEYYTISGQKVDSSAKGIVIEKQKMQDGTVKAVKKIRR